MRMVDLGVGVVDGGGLWLGGWGRVDGCVVSGVNWGGSCVRGRGRGLLEGGRPLQQHP